MADRTTGISQGDPADAATAPDLALDLRPDRAPEQAEVGPIDAGVAPRNCTAGHTCTGNTRCMRTCFSGLVSRCTCAEGHFVCTACSPVDGGPPDASGPDSCATGTVPGRRCDTAGAACQQRGDASGKLCVCGMLGQDRVWVCQ
jgi:hypothetical protein